MVDDDMCMLAWGLVNRVPALRNPIRFWGATVLVMSMLLANTMWQAKKSIRTTCMVPPVEVVDANDGQ